jgi:hypothetical protein
MFLHNFISRRLFLDWEKMHLIETNDWIEAENSLTYSHIEKIKKKHASASKIKEYDFLSSYYRRF